MKIKRPLRRRGSGGPRRRPFGKGMKMRRGPGRGLRRPMHPGFEQEPATSSAGCLSIFVVAIIVTATFIVL